MPYFALRLGFAPSFYRGGTIRIEADVTGVATFEAGATRVFPGLAFALPVDSERMATLFDCCLRMLTGWDKRWSRNGLGGIGIEGRFDSTTTSPRTFLLSSPTQILRPNDWFRDPCWISANAGMGAILPRVGEHISVGSRSRPSCAPVTFKRFFGSPRTRSLRREHLYNNIMAGDQIDQHHE